MWEKARIVLSLFGPERRCLAFGLSEFLRDFMRDWGIRHWLGGGIFRACFKDYRRRSRLPPIR